MKIKECYSCDFYDSDTGGCTCYADCMWYACPIESKKPENIKIMEDLCKKLVEQASV